MLTDPPRVILLALGLIAGIVLSASGKGQITINVNGGPPPAGTFSPSANPEWESAVQSALAELNVTSRSTGPEYSDEARIAAGHAYALMRNAYATGRLRFGCMPDTTAAYTAPDIQENTNGTIGGLRAKLTDDPGNYVVINKTKPWRGSQIFLLCSVMVHESVHVVQNGKVDNGGDVENPQAELEAYTHELHYLDGLWTEMGPMGPRTTVARQRVVYNARRQAADEVLRLTLELMQ